MKSCSLLILALSALCLTVAVMAKPAEEERSENAKAEIVNIALTDENEQELDMSAADRAEYDRCLNCLVACSNACRASGKSNATCTCTQTFLLFFTTTSKYACSQFIG